MVFKAHVPPTLSGLIALFKMDKTQIDTSFWVYLGGRAGWSALNIAANIVIVAALQQSGVIDKLMKRVRNKANQLDIERENDSAAKSDDNSSN